jgi:hypothetical protein
MAENTGEEHPSNPTNPESEKPVIEMIPAIGTDTINPNQETENMEVHHHAHDPAAPHHKKNWKSYFWEFLMLFLAVFCGFLAEYQLEHVVEHNREKQYIESMVDDLKTDSIRIAFFINANKRQVSGFDSLLQNIYHTPYTDSSIKTLYYFKETFTLIQSKINFSKTTISQLKNSGGFRLIRKRAAADSIISYDIDTDRAESQGQAIYNAGQKLLDLSVKIFDGEYVLDYNSTSNYREILNSTKKFTLLNNDEKLIKEYANLAKYKKDVIINYIRQLTNLQRRIPGMIQFLEKEYDLK